MIGKWTHSPAPWQGASGLMQRVLPGGSAQGVMLVPSVFLFPQDGSTGVCGFQPFFLCSFSAGTSGLWTQLSNVMSAISSEAFELCSHFPVPKFIYPVSLPRQWFCAYILQAAAQLAGRQIQLLSLQQKECVSAQVAPCIPQLELNC